MAEVSSPLTLVSINNRVREENSLKRPGRQATCRTRFDRVALQLAAMPAKDFRTAPAPLFEVQPRPRRASLLGSHSLPSLTPAARLQADLAAQQISQLLNQDGRRRSKPASQPRRAAITCSNYISLH